MHAFKKPERPMAVAITSPLTDELLKSSGLSWASVHRNREHMVKAALTAKFILGFETVRVPFDQCVEAEALGIELDFEGCYPKPKRFLEKINEFDVMEKGRTTIVVEAIRDLRNMVSQTTPVFGGVTGPFTVLNYVLGPTKVMLLNKREPKALVEYAEKISMSIAKYAEEMISAGADAIVIEDMASSPDVLNPMIFRSIEIEPLRKLVSMLKIPSILHICGDTLKILSDIAKTGIEVFHVDPKTDLRVAKDLIREVALAGGIDTLLLLKGNEVDIFEAVFSCLNLGIKMVAPACALYPETSVENVRIMVNAVKRARQ